jgi:AraC family cel operon transcriptional repressor
MRTITLFHKDILVAPRSVQLARSRLASARPTALHGHDFYELLWVQNGRLRQHRPEGTDDLAEGDLVFVRPGDVHGLQARSDETLAVSITFRPDLMVDLSARHPRLAGHLFWAEGPGPIRLSQDSRQLAELNQAALRLERGPGDTLAAEGFVLALADRLTAEFQPGLDGAPDWLVRACAAARDPRIFRDGAAGFVRVADRAHPHVSRTVRRWLGQSPTDYVNAQRMRFAAARLTGSADSLAEIAAECGVPNLSHFHKLFRAHHGATPHAFRRRTQSDVIQPG